MKIMVNKTCAIVLETMAWKEVWNEPNNYLFDQKKRSKKKFIQNNENYEAQNEK